MINWLFKKEKKEKKQKVPPFICSECGFTCNECDAAPLCYICFSGRDTFCPGCKSAVVKQIRL